MSVCCQSVVSVLSDADNRLTILPVYRQKGRFSRQPVVSVLSDVRLCCQSIVSLLSETFLVRACEISYELSKN